MLRGSSRLTEGQGDPKHSLVEGQGVPRQRRIAEGHGVPSKSLAGGYGVLEFRWTPETYFRHRLLELMWNVMSPLWTKERQRGSLEYTRSHHNLTQLQSTVSGRPTWPVSHLSPAGNLLPLSQYLMRLSADSLAWIAGPDGGGGDRGRGLRTTLAEHW